jgi:subtilisin family serine protease
MADRWYKRGGLQRALRFLIITSFFAAACQGAPIPVETGEAVETTRTASAETAPAFTPTAECKPRPTSLPSQSPLAVSTAAVVTPDGVVQGRVLPTPYLVPTLVRAPVAWTRSTGEGITIAVARNHEEDLTLLQLVAPGAMAEPLTIDSQLLVAGAPLLDVLEQRGIRLLAIMEPGDFDSQILRQAVRDLTKAGVVVFVNGDLGSSPEERELINAIEADGAITVGRLKYGGRVQGMDIAHREINLFAAYGGENASSDRGAVLTVAAVGAIVLAAQPALGPGALKKQLIETAELVYTGVNAATNRTSSSARIIDPRTGDSSPTDSAFWLRRVNAASAVGVHMEERWPFNAMNLAAAWKTATGHGVIVGVIDGGFHSENPLIKASIVDKFPEQYFSGEQFIHGTLMAKAVLAVAPGASLMFLHDQNLEDFNAMAQNEAEGIDYAIEHSARVLTSSSQAWANTPEMHAAIDRAIAAGVVFIWSDYTGHNEAVIRPGYWRSPAGDVGTFTFFLDEDRPVEQEGGISFAAPQIAGIAAMILQNEPNLTPMQVKQRIMETATVLANGGSLVDAAAAVENHPSGRRMERQTESTGGKVLLQYQLTQPGERSTVELEEAHQNWPVAALPVQDILFYRRLPSTAGPYAGSSQLVAYRGSELALKIEWAGNALSGAVPATLTVMPEGEWQPFYTVKLGEGDVPSLHVETICDSVHLSWDNPQGTPMKRGFYLENATKNSDARLFSLEAETALVHDLLEPVY